MILGGRYYFYVSWTDKKNLPGSEAAQADCFHRPSFQPLSHTASSRSALRGPGQSNTSGSPRARTWSWGTRLLLLSTHRSAGSLWVTRQDTYIPEVSRTTGRAQASRLLSGETQKHLSGSLTEQGHSRTGTQAGVFPVALPGPTRPPKPLPVRPVPAPCTPPL